jgi:hypothetical protein
MDNNKNNPSSWTGSEETKPRSLFSKNLQKIKSRIARITIPGLFVLGLAIGIWRPGPSSGRRDSDFAVL